MRTLLIVIIIFILLFGGSLASYRYIQTTTQSLGAQLETVEQSASAQQWQAAQKELNTAQQRWDKTKTWWTVLLDHQEIDNIDISMKRLEKYIETQDVSLSLGEVSALRLQVDQIYDTEKFTLKNIL